MERNGVTIRGASPADVDAIWRVAAESMRGYSEFAPPGWTPPEPTVEELGILREKLADPRVWYRIAEDSSAGHVAQCGFNPAYEGHWLNGDPIPGLAHLWQLFVLPDHWGTGLADRLHGMAVEEMRSRGYARARLMTPTGQARARAFYERRGWVAHDEVPAAATGPLGLDLIEYRLEL